MKILVFGEILWDEFISPQGNITDKKIGGAPFNFAAHCAKVGAESYIISAIGNDENGVCALDEARRLGIETDYVSVLPQYPTGVCRVTLDGGMPTYDLVSDVAYDHIPKSEIKGDFDAIYMGTLAMRGDESKAAFRNIINSVSAKEVLFDLNLRGDFYNAETINELMTHTTVLKVSDEEIGFFAGEGIDEICKNLAKSFPKLKYICVTLGKEGAQVFDCKSQSFYYSAKPKSKAISTVGAGDSFAAAFLTSLLSGFPPQRCLDRGVALSDFVVTQKGAVPDYDVKTVYKGL